DREELKKKDVELGASTRQQMGHERYFGYVACTRARQRVVLTSAIFDAAGKPLNPSPFLSQLKQLFPSLETETFPKSLDWRKSEHANELIVPLLRNQVQSPISKVQGVSALNKFPALAALRERLKHFSS